MIWLLDNNDCITSFTRIICRPEGKTITPGTGTKRNPRPVVTAQRYALTSRERERETRPLFWGGGGVERARRSFPSVSCFPWRRCFECFGLPIAHAGPLSRQLTFSVQWWSCVVSCYCWQFARLTKKCHRARSARNEDVIVIPCKSSYTHHSKLYVSHYKPLN